MKEEELVSQNADLKEKIALLKNKQNQEANNINIGKMAKTLGIDGFIQDYCSFKENFEKLKKSFEEFKSDNSLLKNSNAALLDGISTLKNDNSTLKDDNIAFKKALADFQSTWNSERQKNDMLFKTHKNILLIITQREAIHKIQEEIKQKTDQAQEEEFANLRLNADPSYPASLEELSNFNQGIKNKVTEEIIGKYSITLEDWLFLKKQKSTKVHDKLLLGAQQIVENHKISKSYLKRATYILRFYLEIGDKLYESAQPVQEFEEITLNK